MANSVDPDEKGPYKPSHLYLHCLQRYLFCRDERYLHHQDMSKDIFFHNVPYLPYISGLNLYHTHLNPFKPNGLFYPYSLDRVITTRRGVWLVFVITMFYAL